MKKTRSFVIVLSAVFLLMNFQIPKNLQKKVTKEIKKTFKIENFQLVPVVIFDEIQKQLINEIKPATFFKIISDDEFLGYVFVDKAPSKTDEFDYLILLDKNGIILKTKVLIYREDYGAEIGSKRWLRQFVGKSKNDTLQYGNDIMAISGATISANSMTNAVNQFLKNLTILYQNKVL